MSDFDDAGKSSGFVGWPSGSTEKVLEEIARNEAFGYELVPGLHDLAFTPTKRQEREARRKTTHPRKTT